MPFLAIPAAESESERLREAGYINQSLSALGNVVAALGKAEADRPHIPYRYARRVVVGCHSPAVRCFVVSSWRGCTIMPCVHHFIQLASSVWPKSISNANRCAQVMATSHLGHEHQLTRAHFPRNASRSRNSKLTRILADTLGGNANAALIATVGPAQQNQVGSGWGGSKGIERHCRSVLFANTALQPV